jgi:L-lactate utilization protein LutB
MDDNIRYHNGLIIKRTADALKKNGFNVISAGSAEDACKKIMDIVKKEDSVGVGGSMTIRDLGLLEKLAARKQNIIQHKQGMSLDESLDIRRKALTADVYMASPNALTMEGTLIFCDGIGNRVSGMIFGPGKIIAIAGINKIVSNEDTGWDRISTVASPVNAKRLNLNTPCVSTGVCMNCNSESRICNIGVTIWKKPRHTDYYVVLVPENLGY